jgi:hypothetical protein
MVPIQIVDVAATDTYTVFVACLGFLLGVEAACHFADDNVPGVCGNNEPDAFAARMCQLT